jgi:hypothetical protein
MAHCGHQHNLHYHHYKPCHGGVSWSPFWSTHSHPGAAFPSIYTYDHYGPCHPAYDFYDGFPVKPNDDTTNLKTGGLSSSPPATAPPQAQVDGTTDDKDEMVASVNYQLNRIAQVVDKLITKVDELEEKVNEKN